MLPGRWTAAACIVLQCLRAGVGQPTGLRPYVAWVYPETGDLVETNFTIFFRVKHFRIPTEGKAIIIQDGKPIYQITATGENGDVSISLVLVPAGGHKIEVAVINLQDQLVTEKSSIYIEVGGLYGYQETAVRSTARTTTVPPFVMVVNDPRQDVVSASLIKSGVWERPWIDGFRKLLEHQPPTTVVDVGANLGLFGLYAAVLGHNIVAFEPLEKNRERLIASAEANGIRSRLDLRPFAASDVKESLALYAYPDNLANGFLVQPGEVVNQRASFLQSVETDMLDNHFAEPIYVMKMDIEGHESRAIKGMQRLLSQFGVQYLFLEFSPGIEGQGLDPFGMIRYLLSLGYNIYDAFDDANPHFKYTEETMHLFHKTEQYNLMVTRETMNPLHRESAPGTSRQQQ
jgi:FkbM family methyltransferase